MKHTTGPHTGIYQRFGIRSTEKGDIPIILRDAAEAQYDSVTHWLDAIEEAAVETLKHETPPPGFFGASIHSEVRWAEFQADVKLALRKCLFLRREIEDDNTHAAVHTAFLLGGNVERCRVRRLGEPHAGRGAKVLQGAREGHRQAYGSESQKSARRQRIVDDWHATRANNANWKLGAVDANVAARHGCSSKTVQRARRKK